MPKARLTTYDYEQSSESGRERHVRVPYIRQTDATPTLHDPVQVTSLLVGGSMCGTSITLDAVHSESIVNFAVGAIYRHGVRNVRTYAGGPAEATWGPINIGDPVYYDAEQQTLSGNLLSTSPATSVGAANSRFGIVVMQQDEISTDFPKGGVGAGNAVSVVCAVLQTGVIES